MGVNFLLNYAARFKMLNFVQANKSHMKRILVAFFKRGRTAHKVMPAKRHLFLYEKRDAWPVFFLAVCGYMGQVAL